jgi:hypothetical protein
VEAIEDRGHDMVQHPLGNQHHPARVYGGKLPSAEEDAEVGIAMQAVEAQLQPGLEAAPAQADFPPRSHPADQDLVAWPGRQPEDLGLAEIIERARLDDGGSCQRVFVLLDKVGTRRLADRHQPDRPSH